MGTKFDERKVNDVTRRSNRRGVKYTRGFLRAQKKRARRLELVPEGSLIVAMDLAHKEHCCWLSNVQKQPVDRLQISNNAAGMEKLIERAEETKRRNGFGKIVFAMEPTGHYWMSVAAYLQKRDCSYVLVQPLSVKRERESTYYRYAKNDFRDAELIGNLTADGKFTFTKLPNDAVWAGLKAAANEYIVTDMMLTAEQMRMHSFMERLYPEYTTAFKGVSSLTALSCLLSIKALPDVSCVEFLAQARAHSMGRIYGSKVLKFHKLASRPDREWGASVYDEGLHPSIVHAAQRYELLVKQHREAQEKLLHFYQMAGYGAYANTIPHVPAAINAAALGLTGNPAQFDSSRCLTKFAGVDIKDNESGDYHGTTPITHRGDPFLRYIAYLTGFILKTHEPVFMTRYKYLISRKTRPLKKNQAIIALGCKYLRVLWTVCTQHVSYDPNAAEHGTQNDQGGTQNRGLTDALTDSV